MEKKHLITILVGFFLFSMVSESFSQRRSSRSRPSKNADVETESFTSWKDKMAYDIYIGNLGFNNGFTLSGKAAVGYKVIDAITLGLGGKAYYQNQNAQGTANDRSITGYGFFPFVRVKFAEQFYVKGEYDFYNFSLKQENFDTVKADFTFPMLGAGYVQGFGKWKVGFELMFMLGDSVVEDTPFRPDPEKSDLYTLIDYNIAILYNF